MIELDKRGRRITHCERCGRHARRVKKWRYEVKGGVPEYYYCSHCREYFNYPTGGQSNAS